MGLYAMRCRQANMPPRAAFGIGSCLCHPAIHGNGEELRVASGKVARCDVNSTPLPSGVKLADDVGAGMPGQPHRRAAGDWDDEDVGVAVVLRAERNRPAVRREDRIGLHSVVGRQPLDGVSDASATNRSPA